MKKLHKELRNKELTARYGGCSHSNSSQTENENENDTDFRRRHFCTFFIVYELVFNIVKSIDFFELICYDSFFLYIHDLLMISWLIFIFHIFGRIFRTDFFPLIFANFFFFFLIIYISKKRFKLSLKIELF